MDSIPPLRFGIILPLAGKKGKRKQAVQAIRGRIPSGERGKCVVGVGAKWTARWGSQCKPLHCELLKPIKKGLSSMSKHTTRKSANATHNTQAVKGKCKQLEIACSPWRGAPPKNRRHARKCAALDRSDWRRVFDGSMSETQHSEYHARNKSFCIRCDVHKRPQVYDACARHAGISWLAQGVSQGLWGLGCTACANFLASGKTCDGARFSKFAKFEVRPESGFCARWLIEQHHKSESHRIACEMGKMGTVVRRAERKHQYTSAVPTQLQPLACPASCAAEGLDALSAEDAALLKGNVPTAAEWRDGWAYLSETLSLRKMGRISEKQNVNSTSGCQRKRKRYRNEPVSYTHLTLPTKRIV